MQTKMNSNSRREDILDAAEEVAIEEGAAHLTLDAVATKAGVSKGGLIYHFPSKRALLKSLIERASSLYLNKMTSALADPENEGNFALAHAKTLLKSDAAFRRLVNVTIIIAANFPDLMKPIQDKISEQYKLILNQSGCGSGGVISLLAANGLFILEHLGIIPFSKTDRRKVVKVICRSAKGE